MDITPPAACQLTSADFATRRVLIQALTRDALLGVERHGRTLRLRYRSDAAARVRDLARLEAQCCAFLTFEVTEGGGHVELVITAPERAPDLTDDVFVPFLPDQPPADAGVPPERTSMATMTAVGVVACAACCAAPLAWPAVLGLAGAGGTLGLAAGASWLPVVLLAGGAGAGTWFWRRRASVVSATGR